MESYVRGKTGEEKNQYLRTRGVISYLALEIYEEAKQRYFVLGVKLDSSSLGETVTKKWFCEEGRLEQLSFITENKPSEDYQFRNNEKKVHLIPKVSDAKSRFKYRMGNLDDRFFELLLKSLAFKPIKDIKSFISQFILPERNIDIDALHKNIRNLKEMQLLLEMVKKQADALENINQTYDSILRVDEQILVIDILLNTADMERVKVEIAEKHKQLEQKRQKIAQDENDSYVIEQDIKSLDDHKVNVQVALNTGETALEVNAIENERTRKKS